MREKNATKMPLELIHSLGATPLECLYTLPGHHTDIQDSHTVKDTPIDTNTHRKDTSALLQDPGSLTFFSSPCSTALNDIFL